MRLLKRWDCKAEDEMDKTIILTNTGTLILSLIALFLLIFSFAVQNRKIAAAMQGVSFLCVLATLIYALLLGATLTEVLVFILVFVAISLISFIPKKNEKIVETKIEAKDTEIIKNKQAEEVKEENNNEL